ncbi:MAG: hypothetical protein O3B75_10470, partial [Planctomycetota bacterium]|nr:hypothetical protein [Planctomycetota bacterium]
MKTILFLWLSKFFYFCFWVVNNLRVKIARTRALFTHSRKEKTISALRGEGRGLSPVLRGEGRGLSPVLRGEGRG